MRKKLLKNYVNWETRGSRKWKSANTERLFNLSRINLLPVVNLRLEGPDCDSFVIKVNMK